MYHIPNDKRAKRSAAALVKGLCQTLQKKKMADVTVVDVTKSAAVSRATFYRLFDNIVDILYWQAEQVLLEALSEGKQEKPVDFRVVFRTFVYCWMQHRKLLEVIAANDQLDILYKVHLAHIGEIKNDLLGEIDLSSKDKEYLAGMLAALIPVGLRMAEKYPADDLLTYYLDLLRNLKQLIALLS